MVLNKKTSAKSASDTSDKKVKKIAAKKSPAKTAKVAVKKVAKKAPVKAPAKKKAEPVAKKTALKKKEDTSLQKLVDAVVDGILEIKGKNISVLDLREIQNRVCDYYIICQADSSTQVSAIADSVEDVVKKRLNERPYHSEGFQNSEWILIDYVTVVVHVFQSHIREFYNLEGLWADAEVTKIAFD
ncbi:MAG: ribosome silencing factor [Bacteroidia bacterium]